MGLSRFLSMTYNFGYRKIIAIIEWLYSLIINILSSPASTESMTFHTFKVGG